MFFSNVEMKNILIYDRVEEKFVFTEKRITIARSRSIEPGKKMQIFAVEIIVIFHKHV